LPGEDKGGCSNMRLPPDRTCVRNRARAGGAEVV
jgi:hypothetical protein